MLTMSNKHKGYRGVWDFWTTASSVDGLQTWRISGPSLIATSHHINVWGIWWQSSTNINLNNKWW